MYAVQQGLFNRIGNLFGGNPNSQQQVYILAQQKIQAAAQQSPLLSEAQKNTEGMLDGMLTSLGFQQVTVTFGERDRQLKQAVALERALPGELAILDPLAARVTGARTDPPSPQDRAKAVLGRRELGSFPRVSALGSSDSGAIHTGATESRQGEPRNEHSV